ncbi:hypothetical protein BV22DRAFT_999201 [Leucogyrophana mollusca]|uniref:Uncharacterized protein n=1 Tax=Leucogyrophana mollusca TaxID=85980 RepID=A0ACB8C0Q3_9AGAM|nr:hypothetical protein BV22DRAFT_999201 [Leucogyrophana mollusca]
MGNSHGSWYQPGNSRCTRQGCTFTGSQKSVEIHMMDRHLIYPPGWEKRKDDWDADPSLKGKPIPIQGTSLLLNTPEAVDGWIAERKKLFPTAEKVEDKKRKLEAALSRGQLTPEDMGLPGRKKRKMEDGHEAGSYSSRGERGGARGRGRGGGRGRGRGGPSCIRPTNEASLKATSSTASALVDIPALLPPHIDSDDSDGAPEVISSKAPIDLRQLDEGKEPPNVKPISEDSENAPVPKPFKAPMAQQPKKPPRNVFASRPTLLRNLLLPEIRITVSNLSQAVRFLVDNDFLRDVELKPGEALEKKIEVVNSSECE